MLVTFIICHMLSLICFFLAFAWLKLIEDWRQMMSLLSSTFKDLSNDRLSDMDKEAISRRASMKLFGFVFRLSWKSATTFVALIAPATIAHYTLDVALSDTIEFSLKPAVLIATLVVSIVMFYVVSRYQHSCPTPNSKE